MVFSSITFLIYFLPITIALVFLVKFHIKSPVGLKIQNVILLIFSLVFYAWGEPVYIFLMISSILFNYHIGLIIGKNKENKENNHRIKSKRAIIIGIGINLLLLGVFKYAGFSVEIVNTFSGLNIPIPIIGLPIGISFFTFQAMTYLIDVYRGETEYQKNVLNLGLYISFFPQLIAGPIVRYHDIAKQLSNRTITLNDFSYGVRRFLIGLGKKVLIANIVAKAADELFALSNSDITTPLAWIAVVSYTIQIYFDFSGYSDMAIGLGRMFGFQFLENFNYPYISSSIQDFWRRWHISLSTFFRDYLYFPLGGSKTTKVKTYRNQFIVFLLCGLWHGASINFVLWGLYHGLFLVLERMGFGKVLKKIGKIPGFIYMILVVMVGWVFFRAENLSQAIVFIKAMFGFDGGVSNIQHLKYLLDKEYILALIFGIIGSTPIFKNYILNPPNLKKRNLSPQILKTIGIIFSVLIFIGIISQNKISNQSGYIEIVSGEPSYQLFYDTGLGFNQSDSLSTSHITNGIHHFEVPLSKISRFRLDINVINENINYISNISIGYYNGFNPVTLEGEELIQSFQTYNQIENIAFNEEKNVVSFESTGSDPYFLISYNLSKIQKPVISFQQVLFAFLISGLFFLILYFIINKKKEMENKSEKSALLLYVRDVFLILIVFILTIIYLSASTYNPFIYFRF